MSRRLLCVAALLLSFAGCIIIQQPDPDLAVVDEQMRHDNLRSFDEIWQRVGTTYLNPLPGRPATQEADALPRIDWMSIAADYQRRVEQAGAQGEARQAMRDAVAQMGLSHFAILPRSLKANEGQSAFQTNHSDCGLTLRLYNDAAIVTRVDAGSPADRAGVKPGWILTAIDDQPVAPMLQSLRGELPHDRLAESRLVDHLTLLLSPTGEQRVRARFIDGNGRGSNRTVTLVPSTTMSVDAGVVARPLNDGTLYFATEGFTDQAGVSNAFRDLLISHPSAQGLIIDLRGNPGGLNAVALDLLSHLMPAGAGTTKIGVMIRRDAGVELAVEPQPPTFDGPVAVLVDGMSMSASEIFARAIQDLHRGRVFGQPTPGVALPSIVYRLPNGERLQYVTADYVSVGGGRLEGVGVTPDVIVPIDRDALLTGQDPAIHAASRWIASSSR